MNEPNKIKSGLSLPFAPEDLEWRIQVTTKDKMKGLAVPYVTNRAIQDRLDDVVGPENWHNEYKPWHGSGRKEAQICGISIYFEGRGFVTKWDGAEDTDVEPIKGGLSDSMKRAAVQWGIGRVLYKMDPVWVNIEQKGNSYIIMDSERPRLNQAYLAMLTQLHLQPAKPGGLQPELTPKQMKSPAANPADPQLAPAPVPFPTRPPFEYRVVSSQLQNGMRNQPSMRLILENREGKKLNAFIRGEHPDLVSGAELHHVQLTMQKQDTVVFHVMTAYEIIPNRPQAA